MCDGRKRAQASGGGIECGCYTALKPARIRIPFGGKNRVRFLEEYKLGHETLDTQHQLLFGLIAELQSEIDTALGRAASTDVLQRLFMYAVVHFATEDELMMMSDYPDTLAHRAEHEAVLANVKRLEAECQAGVPSAREETLRFMKAWASGHVPGVDRGLVEHLAKRGRGAAR